MLSLALTAGGVGGCGVNGGSALSGPCQYELRQLDPNDLTPWDVPAAEDIAKLAGPHSGTWTWSPSTEEIEIEDADKSFAAEAVFEVDEGSFRIDAYVGGGEGVACRTDAVQADGLLSFVDPNRETVASIPITIERTVDQPV